jgi:hypothetical protein
VIGTGGRLSPPFRRRVAGEVSGLVERYVDAAFVEGARGRAAYPGFTPAARKLAVRDRGVLGSAGLGGGSLTPRSGSARVTVLSPGRRPVGATARVRIRLRQEGPAGARRGRDVVLRGRLVLTPTERGWRVFGYDLARSRTAGRGGER